MKSRIKNGLGRVLGTINPHYLSFLAGVTVSAAIEIYINMLWSDRVRYPSGVVASSAMLLLSSILMTSLSLNLQTFRDLVLENPEFLSAKARKEFHQELISRSFWRLTTLTLLSVAAAGIGLLTLGLAL